MRIPTFVNPRFVEFEGEHQGYLTPEIQSYTDELNQALQNNISDNGFVIPTQAATDVSNVLAQMPIGTILYDGTNDEWVGKTGSGLVKFTTTAYP